MVPARRYLTRLLLIFLAIGLPLATARSTSLAAPPAGPVLVGPATIALDPAVVSTGAGAIFTVGIRVDAGSSLVDAAEVHLDFDPTKLRVTDSAGMPATSIAPGTALSTTLQNRVDNALGRIDFGAAALTNFPTGSFRLATITFRTLDQTGAAGTPMIFSLGGHRQTSVTFAGQPTLGGTTDGTVVVGPGTGATAALAQSGDAGAWSPVETRGAPSGRVGQSAVWTGRELIVWGGSNTSGSLNDGASYNPATNSWTPLSTIGAPSRRSGHTGVWIGRELVVWGGTDGAGYRDDGARYSPATDGWRSLPATGAPSPRSGHSAVWTGTEMIVWGGTWPGCPGGNCSDGARYSPTSNTWRPLGTAGAPSGRTGQSAIWTGIELVVWGGFGANCPDGRCQDGARYNPATDTWRPLATAGAPSGRSGHTAVWTGTEMVVWGGAGTGCANGACQDGARYNPATDTWRPLVTAGAPSGRSGHTAVWTGTEMVIWGGAGPGCPDGLCPDGGRYNPTNDTWSVVPSASTVGARTGQTATLAGMTMIVWGGASRSEFRNDGGRYLPARSTAVMLRGSVVLPASAPRDRVPLWVSLYQPGTSAVIAAIPAVADSTGSFSATGIAAGVYDVEVKHPQSLSRRASNVQLDANSPPINFGVLPLGDVDDDDAIDAKDLSILTAGFGRDAGSPDYRPSADLDGDGRITIADVSLLRANLGKSGPLPPDLQTLAPPIAGAPVIAPSVAPPLAPWVAPSPTGTPPGPTPGPAATSVVPTAARSALPLRSPPTKWGVGVYASGAHILDALRKTRPGVILLMDPDPSFARELRQLFPTALIVGRRFPPREEQPLDDPDTRGRRFADWVAEVAVPLKGIVDAWVSYNEPVHGRDDPGLRQYNRFQTAFAERLQGQYGIAAVAGNDPPGTLQPEDYVRYYADAIRASTYFGIHAYAPPGATSLQTNPEWYALRYRKIHQALEAAGIRNVQMVLTEVGLAEGWQGVASAEQMARDFTWLTKELQKDPYVLGQAAFGIFGNGEWRKFDLYGTPVLEKAG